MTLPLPMATLIGLAVDRFVLLAKPDQREPSPMAEGCEPWEWAVAAGLGAEQAPHPLIAGTFPGPVDIGANDAATIAHAALQKLAARAVVERIGGLPMRYRPLVR